MYTAAGAFEGDSVVWVRMGVGLVRCYARQEKAQRIVVEGKPCDHVAEAADGAWIYQQTPW